MRTQMLAITLCVLGLGAFVQAMPSGIYPEPVHPVVVPVHHKADVVGAVGHHLHGKVGYVSDVVGEAVGTVAGKIVRASTNHILHAVGSLLASSSIPHEHPVVVPHPAPVVPHVHIPPHPVSSYGTPYYHR